MAQLIGKDVTLGYEGNVVIEHLNFSVQAGDYLYIVGENGSGKSTLMKAIPTRSRQNWTNMCGCPCGGLHWHALP